MKRTAAFTTFIVLGIGASSVHALDLKGSDTLETITQSVLANCPGTDNITYIGGGSSSGEQAMVDKDQEVAPMSRFLRSGRACQADDPSLAEGLAHSLDGLAVVRAEEGTVDCTDIAFTTTLSVQDLNGEADLQCPGCSGSDYIFADHTDALRVLFAGMHNDGGDDIANQDCDSDVRHTLVSNWENFFESCDESCDEILRAWRRADLSGTTDTFLSLLDLPDIDDTPFCNGNDLQDNDPIRRPCTDGEQVCAGDGTLGVVIPVFVPEGLDPTIAYNANECQFGLFDFQDAPFITQIANGTCPNGTGLVFGKCLTPQDSDGNYGCLNPFFNLPAFSPLDLDGRVYNRILRDADGTTVLDANSRELIGSFYRLHTTTTTTNADACTQPSATLQIGCLTQASACSVGFAGREAADSIAGTDSLAVNGVLPTNENVRKLLQDPVPADVYPLSRKLWFNTLVGFDNIVDSEQATLAACFQDRTVVDAAAAAAGFITLDDDGTIPVERVAFDDSACTP